MAAPERPFFCLRIVAAFLVAQMIAVLVASAWREYAVGQFDRSVIFLSERMRWTDLLRQQNGKRLPATTKSSTDFVPREA